MEHTLNTVLRAIGNPALAEDLAAQVRAAGVPSRSPSPASYANIKNSESVTPMLPHLTGSTGAPSRTPSSAQSQHPHAGQRLPTPPPASPKLHSLPDNTLNPLGLLAEASLANRRAQATGSPIEAVLPASVGGDPNQKVGVASDMYFKPGKCYIDRLLVLLTSRGKGR